MRARSRWLWVAMVTVLTLVIAACGDDAGEEGEERDGEPSSGSRSHPSRCGTR